MTTRADTRNQVRRILSQFVTTGAVGTGGIDSSSTNLPVVTPGNYTVGDVLLIATEEMLVRGKGSDGTSLTVQRGYDGTTAAAHIAAVAITVFFAKSVIDSELNQAINYGINATFRNPRTGDFGIWIDTIDTTLATVSGQREYTIPSGLSFISTIEIQDSDDNYQISRHYRIIGTKIVFLGDPSNADKTIRVSGVGYQAQLTSDATAYDLADEQIEFIEASAALTIFEWRLGRRLQATVFSAAVNDRAGQPDEFVAAINYLKRRRDEVRAREGKQMKSGYMTVAKR